MTYSQLNNSFNFKEDQDGIRGGVLLDGDHNWKDKKCKSMAISLAYGFYEEFSKISDKISECGSYLKFSTCPLGHEKRLYQASFCKSRLCVMCQWRKSLLVYHQVYKLVHAHKEKYSSDIPIFLTLTIPNVSSNDLSDGIDLIQNGFKKLMKRRQVKRSVRSWFRGLEVTYNNERDDYHPHFHVLLMVPFNYFKKDRGLYISRDEWLQMWQESMGMLEITQVDIRRVKKRSKNKPLESAVAECTKYATKPSDYIDKLPGGDYVVDPSVIKDLHSSLKGRRLTGFGGLFFKLSKEFKLKKVEDSDLINITEDESSCSCSICKSTLIEELFRWSSDLKSYVG